MANSQSNQLLKFLRPLLFFVVVLLALLGYREHKKWMERTCINFTVTLAGQSLMYGVEAKLDGVLVTSGRRIALGKHTLIITHPKAETFTTNFFGWYGGLDCGEIHLQRAMGSLNVTANPPAQTITVTGPEFSLTLHDSTGTNVLVPTDKYRVTAQYARWSDAKDYVVTTGSGMPCSFNPMLGALSLTCNQSGATYQVRDANGRDVEASNLPATLAGLPSDTYQLTVTYHNHELQQSRFVAANKTTDVPFQFVFGAVRFDSVPPGAAVIDGGGNNLGVTPLLVTELPPATSEFKLQLYNYADVPVSVTVAADQTNTVSTNLVSLAYFSGMQRGQEYMAVSNYNDALLAFADALKAKPGDAEAWAQGRKANLRATVEAAKALAAQGDYIGAGLILKPALAAFPDDAEAKALLPLYQSHEAEQKTQMVEKQAFDLFESACGKIPDAGLFDPQTYTTAKLTPAAARDALVKSVTEQWPKATVGQSRDAGDNLYLVIFNQRYDNPAITKRRDLVVVIGRNKAGQTLFVGKTIEYQFLADRGWTPVHSSRMPMTPDFENQVNEGILMLLKKIKLAVGDANSY